MKKIDFVTELHLMASSVAQMRNWRVRVTRALLTRARKGKDERLQKKLKNVKSSPPDRTKRETELTDGKGASSWITVNPVKDICSLL